MKSCAVCAVRTWHGGRLCVDCLKDTLPIHRPENADVIEAALKRAATLRRYHDRLRGGSPLSGTGWEQRPGADGGRVLRPGRP